MKKLVFGALLATACCGLSLCAQNAASSTQNGTQAATPPEVMGGHRPGRQLSTDERLEKLTHYLNLTPEQQQKIRPILENETQQMESLRDDTSVLQEDRWQRAQQIMATTQRQIKPLLNPQQQEQYEQMTARRSPPPAQGSGTSPGQAAPTTPAH